MLKVFYIVYVSDGGVNVSKAPSGADMGPVKLREVYEDEQEEEV
jgi:hypothetical protein